MAGVHDCLLKAGVLTGTASHWVQAIIRAGRTGSCATSPAGLGQRPLARVRRAGTARRRLGNGLPPHGALADDAGADQTRRRAGHTLTPTSLRR